MTHATIGLIVLTAAAVLYLVRGIITREWTL